MTVRQRWWHNPRYLEDVHPPPTIFRAWLLMGGDDWPHDADSSERLLQVAQL
jgi:hypothetical protein